jgi:hypothetical protein
MSRFPFPCDAHKHKISHHFQSAKTAGATTDDNAHSRCFTGDMSTSVSSGETRPLSITIISHTPTHFVLLSWEDFYLRVT